MGGGGGRKEKPIPDATNCSVSDVAYFKKRFLFKFSFDHEFI